MTYDEAVEVLSDNGQDHILQFWNDLSDVERESLLHQISELDFPSVKRMHSIRLQGSLPVPEKFGPAKVVPAESLSDPAAVKVGEDALRAGKVGAILVAGGQGSRLGYDGPKGAYSIGPVSGASLFEIHTRKILALSRKYGAALPFYIMTSEVNDEPTKAFFEENDYFGIDRDQVMFFTQGMWPALDEEGKIVLESKSRIFMSPDGHGGILTALDRKGMLADMKRRGLSTLFYFQVDNPLVEIADPAFIGMHLTGDAEISVKVCSKRDAAEGLGVIVEMEDGHNTIVEYSDLTLEQKEETLDDGELRLKYGSVAIHVLSYDFLCREASQDMPLHIAHKKVTCCDKAGNIVKPDEPNVFKFEKFIFDVIPDADRVVNVEFLREEEFSPVKNAEGNDSPETTMKDMILKAARRLAEAGADVPVDENGMPLSKIEIDPCFALNALDLKEKLDSGFVVDCDIYLGE